MALMGFREPNQARWVGIRPAHRGEQVWAYDSVVAGSLTIYTVPSGKTLYLVEAHITCLSNVSGSNYMYIKDGGGVKKDLLLSIKTQANHAWTDAHYNPAFPLEVPEDYYFEITAGAGLWIHGTIQGWVE